MKLTKSQLRKIIKEEILNVLKESDKDKRGWGPHARGVHTQDPEGNPKTRLGGTSVPYADDSRRKRKPRRNTWGGTLDLGTRKFLKELGIDPKELEGMDQKEVKELIKQKLALRRDL